LDIALGLALDRNGIALHRKNTALFRLVAAGLGPASRKVSGGTDAHSLDWNHIKDILWKAFLECH